MTDIQDGAFLSGEVRAYVFDGDLAPDDVADLGAFLLDPSRPSWGRCIDAVTETNLVVNTGRSRLVQLAVASSTVIFQYMGLSTSAIVPASADLKLPNEIARNLLAINQQYQSYYLRMVGYFTTVSFGSTGIAGEAIYDTASTGGTMLAESSITVSKTTTQGLVVDHRILFST